MSAPVSIQVPASTSNLGAGFDCIGVALDLWLNVDARLEGGGAGFAVSHGGTLAALDLPPDENRLVAGFTAACTAAGASLDRGVAFVAHSAIPVGRGLGSSAAATVAGALAANSLLHLGLDDGALLRICAEIEGHADNSAAALGGGVALVTRGARGYAASALDVHPDIALVLAVPDFVVETSRARAVLPEFVPHRIAAAAAARAAALVRGLATADAALLAVGLDDVLHVPFRKRLVPGYTAVTAAARHAGGYGATLSGSGSSIVALAPQDRADAVAEALEHSWRSCGVRCDVIQPSIVREVVCH